MDKTDLGLKSSDIITATLKSAAGAVPGIGSLLSELIGNIIPHQRINRLEKFVKILDEKLNLLKDEISRSFEDDECVRLFEEGFYQASKAVSDERREYIASVLVNGLENDQIKYAESRYLMNILDELTDIEIIWLRSYLVQTLGGDEEFREKHMDILSRVFVSIGSSEYIKDKGALQDSYMIHLKNLGLIKSHIKKNRDDNPVFNKITGEPEPSSTYITTMGRLLLRHIGFDEPKSSNIS